MKRNEGEEAIPRSAETNSSQYQSVKGEEAVSHPKAMGVNINIPKDSSLHTTRFNNANSTLPCDQRNPRKKIQNNRQQKEKLEMREQ